MPVDGRLDNTEPWSTDKLDWLLMEANSMEACSQLLPPEVSIIALAGDDPLCDKIPELYAHPHTHDDSDLANITSSVLTGNGDPDGTSMGNTGASSSLPIASKFPECPTWDAIVTPVSDASSECGSSDTRSELEVDEIWFSWMVCLSCRG